MPEVGIYTKLYIKASYAVYNYTWWWEVIYFHYLCNENSVPKYNVK